MRLIGRTQQDSDAPQSPVAVLDTADSLLDAVLESARSETVVVDGDGRVVASNSPFRRHFFRDGDPTGYTVQELAAQLDQQPMLDMLQLLAHALQSNTECTVYTRETFLDTERWHEVTATPLSDRPGAVLRAHDVTDLVRAAKSGSAGRTQDALTGVLTEQGLREALQQDMSTTFATHCVVMLDIDQFSVIRQTLGYDAADETVRHVASNLRRHVPHGGHLARMMGDEFCVTFVPQSALDVDRVSSELRDAVRQPMTIRGRNVRITASVGSTMTDSEANLDLAMQHAELAMQEAGKRGGNRCVVYAPELAEPQEGMMRLWNALRSALQFRQMEVWFQPVVSLATDRPVAAEALCRWHHPQFGDVAPGAFIPIAERNSEILNIGSFVHGRSAEVMNMLRSSRTTSLGNFQISVNASPNELAWPEFATNMLARIKANDALPEWFALEVTEKALQQRDPNVMVNLQIIRDAGVTISLDDFGTGYSSLERLRDLPVDRVKIDRRFVATLMENERTERLIAAIIALADELGIDTVAEGVETSEQAAKLRSLGCRSAQGFLFAPAVPDSELVAVLRDLSTTGAHHPW